MQCYRCGTHAYRWQGKRMCCQVRLRTKGCFPLNQSASGCPTLSLKTWSESMK